MQVEESPAIQIRIIHSAQSYHKSQDYKGGGGERGCFAIIALKEKGNRLQRTFNKGRIAGANKFWEDWETMQGM